MLPDLRKLPQHLQPTGFADEHTIAYWDFRDGRRMTVYQSINETGRLIAEIYRPSNPRTFDLQEWTDLFDTAISATDMLDLIAIITEARRNG